MENISENNMEKAGKKFVFTVFFIYEDVNKMKIKNQLRTCWNLDWI